MIDYCRALIQKPWAPFLLIFIVGTVYFGVNLNQFPFDIYDETLYIIHSQTMPHVEWSPLYSVFYSVLSWGITDRLIVYYASLFLVNFTLFPLAIFLLTWRLFSSRFFSTISASFFLLTQMNLAEIPRVHILNFSVLLLAFLSFHKVRSKIWSAVFFFICGMLIHLRVENLVGVLAFVVLGVSYLFLACQRRLALGMLLLSLFSISCGYFSLSWGGGRPLMSNESRSLRAFQDHYVWRSNGETKDLRSFEEQFPRAKSLGEFVLRYPGPMLKHALNNALDLPASLLKGWSPVDRHSGDWAKILFVFMLVGGLSFSVSASTHGDPWIKLFLLALCVQALFLSLVMQPWGKYLVPLSVSTFLFCASILPRSTWVVRRTRYLVGFFLVYVAYVIVFDGVLNDARSNKNLLHVKEWQKVAVQKDDVVMFNNFIPWYSGPVKRIVMDQAILEDAGRFEDLNDWVKHYGITLVCTSSGYPWPTYVGEPTRYENFIKNIRQYGFEPYEHGGSLMECFRK